MIVDTYLVYQFLRRLATPFEKWDAYKNGIIDKDGKVLRKRKDLSDKERDSWGRFDIVVANLKKLLAKVPGGSNPVASYAAALLLMKEGIEDMDETTLTEALNEEIANVTSNVAGVKGGDEPPVNHALRMKILRRRKNFP